MLLSGTTPNEVSYRNRRSAASRSRNLRLGMEGMQEGGPLAALLRHASTMSYVSNCDRCRLLFNRERQHGQAVSWACDECYAETERARVRVSEFGMLNYLGLNTRAKNA